MESTLNGGLLQKYFEGNTTIFEKKMIDDWAIELENQEIFYQLLSKHEIQNPQFVSDVGVALQKHNLMMKIERSIVPKIPIKHIQKYNYSRWVAAVLIFLVGFGACGAPVRMASAGRIGGKEEELNTKKGSIFTISA